MESDKWFKSKTQLLTETNAFMSLAESPICWILFFFFALIGETSQKRDGYATRQKNVASIFGSYQFRKFSTLCSAKKR